MKRWLVVGLSLLASCLLLPAVYADLLPRRGPQRPIRPAVNPFPQPGGGRPLPIKVKLVVQVDEKAKLPVLKVPFNLAQGKRIGTDGQVLPPAGADAGRRLGVPTLIAGLALTLAFASGGLWLVRRRGGRTLAILIVVGVFAAGTAAVWADISSPFGGRRPRRPAPVAMPVLKLPAGIELTDQLILEPVAADDHLTLIVPKAMVSAKEKKPGK